MSSEHDTDLLGHTHAAICQLHEIQRLLLDELRARNDAPIVRPLTLTAQQPVQYDQEAVDTETRSVAVLNPNPIVIYWGTGGGSPTAAARAIPQPANSLLVLPLLVAGFEIGADPALLTSDAPIFVMRYASVQAAFLGRSA